MSLVGDPSEKPEGRMPSMLPTPLHSSMFPVAAMGAAGNEAVRDYAHRMGIEVPRAPRVPQFGTAS